MLWAALKWGRYSTVNTPVKPANSRASQFFPVSGTNGVHSLSTSTAPTTEENGPQQGDVEAFPRVVGVLRFKNDRL